MRLEGQAKMGYYPTPLSQVALIAPWLEASPRGLSRAVELGKPVRLLDPCAGEGEALQALTQALAERRAQVETWGVELSPARAEEAAARLDRVLPTAWEQTHVRDDTVSLCHYYPGIRNDIQNVEPLLFIVHCLIVHWNEVPYAF